MKKLMIVIAIFALTACVSAGNKFNMADVDTFQPGVTTYEEVVAKLGKPRMQSFNKDGSKKAAWSYFQTVGFSSDTRVVGMQFDTEGKFVRITTRTE